MPLKPSHKCHLILGEDKLLGSLLLLKDKNSRDALKFSLKSKLDQTTVWHDDLLTGERKKLEEPKGNPLSFDISYKFSDNLLEIKREIPKQEPFRKFLKLEPPFKSYLFALRIQNWQTTLPRVHVKADSLLLMANPDEEKVIVFFSFLGENGLPFLDSNYMNEKGRTIAADLPFPPPFSKICIGVAPDPDNNEEMDLTFQIPVDKNPFE